MESFKVEFDREYGIDKRTGWSICINGFFMAALERYLVVAICKAFYCYWFVVGKEYR